MVHQFGKVSTCHPPHSPGFLLGWLWQRTHRSGLPACRPVPENPADDFRALWPGQVKVIAQLSYYIMGAAVHQLTLFGFDPLQMPIGKSCILITVCYCLAPVRLVLFEDHLQSVQLPKEVGVFIDLADGLHRLVELPVFLLSSHFAYSILIFAAQKPGAHTPGLQAVGGGTFTGHPVLGVNVTLCWPNNTSVLESAVADVLFQPGQGAHVCTCRKSVL
jgi:hypothetical protein